MNLIDVKRILITDVGGKFRKAFFKNAFFSRIQLQTTFASFLPKLLG